MQHLRMITIPLYALLYTLATSPYPARHLPALRGLEAVI